jgi:hypothetical protein
MAKAVQEEAVWQQALKVAEGIEDAQGRDDGNAGNEALRERSLRKGWQRQG